MRTWIPTKGNLLQLKKQISLAKMGYELMERKRVVLVKEMTSLLQEVRKIRNEFEKIYSKAYLALQEANITLGVITEITKSIPIDNGIFLKHRSVMGVDIPKIDYQKKEVSLSYGIGSTNTKFDFAYHAFLKVKEFTLFLAEIDSSCYRLANEIIKSQKRANALKNIVIPEYEKAYGYIENVLEEKDREEFVRSKVIKRRQSKTSIL